MQAISNNPYRVLGVLADATAREIYRQSNMIKKFLIADQISPPDCSFPQLGIMNRNVEKVNAAIAKLNLDEDKMTAALFWFYKGNNMDELNFEALKDGNVAMAKYNWENLIIETGENGKKYWKNITQKNYSAFHNWFVLEFFGNPNGSFIANIKFIESDYYTDLIEKATHSTFTITRKELQLQFLNIILQEIENDTVDLSMDEFIKTVNNENFSAKQDFLKGVSLKLVSKLSLQIEIARKQRIASGANAAGTGETLYKQAENDLELLKSITDAQDFTYSDIANKVADEILQCGIDYFNYYENSSTDPSSLAIGLYQKAKTIAAGLVCHQRCEEKIKNLQEWINHVSERKMQRKIESDSNAVVQLLAEFERKSETIANAKSLINQSKPYLDAIKNVLEASDSAYLALSTRIASLAQNYIIAEVNKMQNEVTREIQLKETLKEAWEATELLGSLDMERDFRTDRYTPSKASLKDIRNQLEL